MLERLKKFAADSRRTRRLPLLFIALSVPAFVLYSCLVWTADDCVASFLTLFGIALQSLWLVLLASVAWTLHRGAPGGKELLLIMACVVGIVSVIDLFDENESFALFAAGALEATLLFAAYVTTPVVAAPPEPEADARKKGVLWNLWRVLKYLLIAWGTVCGLLVAFVIALAYWSMSSGVFSTEDFDSKAWLKPDMSEDESCYRGRMAGDIKKRLLTPGMSRGDVERLLGQPDGTVAAGEYQYVLGICSGFEGKTDHLSIFFDEQGMLVRATIAAR